MSTPTRFSEQIENREFLFTVHLSEHAYKYTEILHLHPDILHHSNAHICKMWIRQTKSVSAKDFRLL